MNVNWEPSIYDRVANNLDFVFWRTIYHRPEKIDTIYQYIDNFIRTYAEWSFICYMIGLGDRHGENILLTEGFKVIHIDLEYVIDHGLNLPVPELVPFRFTKSI